MIIHAFWMLYVYTHRIALQTFQIKNTLVINFLLGIIRKLLDFNFITHFFLMFLKTFDSVVGHHCIWCLVNRKSFLRFQQCKFCVASIKQMELSLSMVNTQWFLFFPALHYSSTDHEILSMYKICAKVFHVLLY